MQHSLEAHEHAYARCDKYTELHPCPLLLYVHAGRARRLIVDRAGEEGNDGREQAQADDRDRVAAEVTSRRSDRSANGAHQGQGSLLDHHRRRGGARERV